MKRTLAKLLSISLLTSALVLLALHQNEDEREAYEDFLKETSQNFHSNVSPEEEEGQPDHALFYNFLQTLDPKTKSIPAGGIIKAAEQVTQGPRLREFITEGVEGNEALAWSNIPANLSGRVRAIAIDPVRTDNIGGTGPKLWVGSVTGGLWVKEDGESLTKEWTQVQTGINENISVSAIVFDPMNDDIMYIGTGESYTAINIYRESSAVGTGIWKSTDHGVTWTQLEATSNFKYVNDIVIKEENGSSVLYAAVVSGKYKGRDFISDPSDGLYRSVDAGITWNQVIPNMPNSNAPYAISDIELSSSGRLFAGSMRNIDRTGGGVILYSDNGIDWTSYSQIPEAHFGTEIGYFAGRTIIKAAPSDPNRVYALVSGGHEEATTGWIRDVGRESLIMQSFDGGENWSQFALPNPSFGQWSNITWHAAALAVDPHDPNNIILSALRGFRYRDTRTADMSTNTSLNWLFISDWIPNQSFTYIHADNHQIIFDPIESENLFFTTDGGVFYSSDGDQDKPKFRETNRNLNTIQYYSVALSGTTENSFLLAGTQDNHTLKYAGEPIDSESAILGGDGAFCFIDQNNPNLEIAAWQYNNYNFFFRDTGIRQRIDNGGIGIFINPADYDSKNNILYTNLLSFRVNTATSSDQPLLRIRVIGQGITEDFPRLNIEARSPISNIKVSPHAPEGISNLFFGTQAGRLFKVENANSLPEAKEITGAAFPTSNISSIDIGRSEDEILVTFSNFGVESVWYSNDGGDNWNPIESNLPDIPVRWGLFNPINQDEVFLATELGVWSTDLSVETNPIWIQNIDGMTDVRVDMIKIRKSDGWFVAATHGRGLFETYLNTEDVITSVEDSRPELKLTVFPNPVSTRLSIDLNDSFNGKGSFTLLNIHGKKIMEHNVNASKFQIDVSQLPRGVYLLNIKTDQYKYVTRRVILQ